MSPSTTLKSPYPLILSGSGYGLTIAPKYEEQKTVLLKHAALIVEINDSVSDAAADQQIKALGAMRILIEKSRVIAKQPATDFGKDVDKTAKEFTAQIDVEEARLKKARGGYAVLVEAERQRVLVEIRRQQEAAAQALREADAAAAKIEAARLAAEAAAEQARIAAEDAAFNATTPEEDAQAARMAEEVAKAEAARMADQQAAAAAETARIAALPAAVVTIVPEASKGVKMKANYRVTDIDALYLHNAGLVTLTERRMEILDAIARGKIGDTLPTIPGLEIFLEPYVR